MSAANTALSINQVPYRYFLRFLLPKAGRYCAAGIRNARVIERFHESLSDLYNSIEQLKTQSLNVYITPVSFDKDSRKAVDAKFVRSFFVDLDVIDPLKRTCDDHIKKYETKDLALQALNTFVNKHNLPEPITIDSGTGAHAYWLLREHITVNQWKPYAVKLKKYCQSHGLKIDAAVTADAARLMRCPDTLNYKTDPPSPAVIPFQNPRVYEFSYLAELFDSLIPKEDEAKVKAKKRSSNRLETPQEIANLKHQLNFISADCGYDTYRQVIWSILSTGWSVAEDIARTWSETAPHRFDEKTLCDLINSYDPDRPNAPSLGTVFHYARIGGWNG